MNSEDGDKTFDLREYKRYRGNRKSKVIHAYDKSYTLEEMSIEELTKLCQSAKEAVCKYEEIQSVIMLKKDDHTYAGEDLSDESQFTTNLNLLRGIRALKKACIAWTESHSC